VKIQCGSYYKNRTGKIICIDYKTRAGIFVGRYVASMRTFRCLLNGMQNKDGRPNGRDLVEHVRYGDF